MKFRTNVQECLEALVEYGAYGKTVEEVIEHLVNHKIFRLRDIKDATIWGLLKRDKDRGWIIQNIPDLSHRNATAYNTFLRQAELEGLPDGVRTRLAEEKRQIEERRQKSE